MSKKTSSTIEIDDTLPKKWKAKPDARGRSGEVCFVDIQRHQYALKRCFKQVPYATACEEAIEHYDELSNLQSKNDFINRTISYYVDDDDDTITQEGPSTGVRVYEL